MEAQLLALVSFSETLMSSHFLPSRESFQGDYRELYFTRESWYTVLQVLFVTAELQGV